MTDSLDQLLERVASVPQALQQTLSGALPVGRDTFGAEEGIDVVGVGASEMPARLLVGVLGAAGARARFVPISRFVGSGPSQSLSSKSSLVVFSQGLSPNARLALGHAKRYRRSVLFTSVRQEDGGEKAQVLREFPGAVLRHGPISEGATLIRLVGPLCAAALALRFAAVVIGEWNGASPEWFGRLSEVPQAYRRFAEAAPEPLNGDPDACVCQGHELDFAAHLMWKWQEALYVPLPAAVDILAFAHGPLQSHYAREAVFLTLTPAGGDYADVERRFHSVLHTERHRVRSLSSSLPWPLSLFEYDSQLTQLALVEMRSRGLDPEDWPGKLQDGPLYSLTTPAAKGSS